MATKEDVLEQIVEEYLLHNGYFVQHNLKFRPRKDHPDFIVKQDSNHSDIDVIGYNPRRMDRDRVVVVSCKSWQTGFRPKYWIEAIEENKIVYGKEAWRSFRELAVPKWSEAFVAAVEEATGTNRFTYATAVTRLLGDRTVWEKHEPFRRAVGGNPVKIWTFQEMTADILGNLTNSLAATEVGRMLQLFKAAGIDVPKD